MELKKPIYYFILILSLITIVSLLYNQFRLINGLIWTVLTMGLLIIGLFFCNKIINDFDFENRYFKSVFTLLFLYQVVQMTRGIIIDFHGFKEMILSDYLLWPFLIPLFVFFNKKLSSFFYLLNAIYFLGITFLAMSVIYPSLIINRTTAEPFIHPFAFGCGFLLLNARYLSNKKKIIAIAALIVGLLSFVYLARRNGVVSYLGLLIAGLLFYLRNLSAGKFFKFIPVFIAIFIFMAIGLEYVPASLTSRLSDRVSEDSRTDVFSDLFKDMDNNIFFGKGMNGKYYSPSGGELPDEGVVFISQDYRDAIENGYLQLFLNGGIVYNVLFILVTLPAVLLGFFKSNNQFVQACAAVIFLWLIDMAIYGLPRLTLEYILVWISVGVCYKKSMRQLSNEEIMDEFNFIETT